MGNRYWIAGEEVAKVVHDGLDEWDGILKKASKIARQIGANITRFYSSRVLGTLRVTGFMFTGKELIDTTKFVRIKGEKVGWRPRANSALAKQVSELKTDFLSDVSSMIGMETFGFDDGLRWRQPGVDVIGGTVYLILPDDVNAKGCTRISDLEYEQAVEANKKNKSAGKKRKPKKS